MRKICTIDKNRRIGLKWGSLVASILAAGCTNEEQAASPPPVVRIAVAISSDSTRGLGLSGELTPDVSVAATFRVAGTVQKVLVDEGQHVTAGQPMALLERGSLENQLAIAKAKAMQADDAWTRMEPMHRNGTIPDIKWVEVETGRDQAKAMLAMSQRDLDDATLRAPIDGLVARKGFEAGEQVAPGMASITIVRTGTMLATVAVAEKDVSGLIPGMPARVEVDAVDGVFQGRIREIGVEADPFTRTYKVKIAVPNPDGRLRVGMVAKALLRIPDAEPAVLVPVAAVLTGAESERYAWVEAGGRVQRRGVRVDGFSAEGVRIDSGLRTGERLVVSGTPMLAEGARVRVGN